MPRVMYLILIILFFLLLLPNSIAQSVGISPPVLDLGEIEPGVSKIARFFLVTSSEEKFVVQLSATRGDIDAFMKGKYGRFVSNFSEEDVSSWVKFIRNPVELERTTQQQRTKAGSPIVGAREIIFILKVPENAEPGYHTGIIMLKPISTPEGRFITISAVTPLTFIFKVPGDAIRSGKIIDFKSGDYIGGRLNVDIFFQNTGTVTIRTKPAEIKVFDERGTLDSFSSLTGFVGPGETVKLIGFWYFKGIKEGEYDATAKIDYTTDHAFKESTLEVYPRPYVPTPRVVEKEFVLPWWAILIIIIIIIIAGYLYYKG